MSNGQGEQPDDGSARVVSQPLEFPSSKEMERVDEGMKARRVVYMETVDV